MCYKNLNGRPKVLQARVIRLNTDGYFKCTFHTDMMNDDPTSKYVHIQGVALRGD